MSESDAPNQESAPTNTESSAAIEQDTNKRAFTIKSLVFGIVALLFTIAICDFNDFYLKQTPFVSNHLPPGPIFLVLGLAIFWNPSWRNRWFLLGIGIVFNIFLGLYYHYVRESSFFGIHSLALLPFIILSIKPLWLSMRERMFLSSRELMVALLILFAGAWTAGAGLNRFFTYIQVVPWTYYSNNIQMQKYETIEYIPGHVWPGGGLNEIGDNDEEKKRIYDAFATGYEQQGTEGIPWDAWMPSLLGSWLPLLALFSICLIAVSLIVHRQWAHHEQLSYPIAQIGSTLFAREKKRTLPDIFYSKQFWIAASVVMVFHGIRLLHAWHPDNFPSVPNETGFHFIWNVFPVFSKSGGFWLNNFSFFFSIVGICYFLSREIGLTIGLSQFILAILSAQIYLSTGSKIGSEDTSNMRAGAYIAYACVILFTGRNYYKAILWKALTFKPASDYEEDGVFAARILVVAFIGLIFVLSAGFQIDVLLAIVFSLLSILLFVVFARIICETGIPYLQIGWNPGALLIKFLGPAAIGAAPLVVMYYISAVLFSDPKEAMLPYIANGYKMAENYKIKLRRVCTMMMIVAVAAIFISISARIYQHYTYGMHATSDAYGSSHIPNSILNNATRDLIALDDLGLRPSPAEASSPSLIERISNIKLDARVTTFLMAGAAGVILFFFLRFRFTGFALHPVLFLVWDTYPIQKTFYSFLIGWTIRELIVRFGGGKIYQESKPFFFGIIFGELFMGVLGLSVGFIYYLFANEIPAPFKVFVS